MGLTGTAFLDDMMVAIPFTFFLYCLIHYSGHSQKKNRAMDFYHHFAKRISGFSYTLYLVHYPIIMFLFAIHHTLGGERMQPSLNLYLLSIVLSTCLMILAYFISLVTEEKTASVKHWLSNMLK